MPPDRSAILARRALFMASALAGITAQSRAAEPPPCVPRGPVSDEDRDAAKALFKQGTATMTVGDYPRAVEQFRKAFELSGVPGLLLHLADAERKAGDLGAAHAHVSELLRCSDSPLVRRQAEELLARLEEETATLRLEGGMPGTNVQLDGQAAGTLPLSAPLRVAPGRHEIVLSGGPCGEQRHTVEISARDSQVITFESSCEPRVCLQPCLSPPPPPPPESLPRLGVGAGPLASLAVGRSPGVEPRFLVGALIEAFYVAPLDEGLGLKLGVAALPAGNERGALVPVGADVEALFARGVIRLGLGTTLGWAFADVEASESETWRPRPSLFVHPYLQPFGLRISGHVETGLHAGFLFSRWSSANDESFRLGYVTTSVWLRIYFGEREREWEDVALTLQPGTRLLP